LSRAEAANGKPDLSRYRAFMIDLDGVVWRGGQPIQGAVEAINRLLDMGFKVVILTNNATRTRDEYRAKLKALGVKTEKISIVTSAYATAMFLKQLKGLGRAYVVGEVGLAVEMARAGHHLVSEDPVAVDYVVVGLDRQLHYTRLARAYKAIKAGALFVATNTDATVPCEDGEYPGAGAVVAALERALGRPADYVVGKPEPHIFQVAFKEAGVAPGETLVVGDRLETDILGAAKVGADSALVLTGVTRLEDLGKSGFKPTYVVESLEALVK